MREERKRREGMERERKGKERGGMREWERGKSNFPGSIYSYSRHKTSEADGTKH